MKYIPRHIAPVVQRSSKTFPVTVISGARQVGKSTLLMTEHPDAEYVSFDRLDALRAARDEPERFLQSLRHPAIIDEVQYCPDLFRYIKLAVDKDRDEKGSLFLTGSQRFQMMTGLDESLAGRAGIIEMLGLSLREILRDGFDHPFVPTEAFLRDRKPRLLEGSLWELIFRGDMPELIANPSMDAQLYYQSYVETYLRRDVRDIAHVGDISKFNLFLKVVANLHGQILNKTSLANACDASFATVERWLSVLEASNITYYLRPFSGSTKKRLVKSPKLYFLNSGLVSYLCGMDSPEDLERSERSGVFFEGFVVSEIVKSFLNKDGRLPDLYFYRDSNGKEIDVVIARGKDLYPVEIKQAEIARPTDTKAFSALDEFSGYQRKQGAVVCTMGSIQGYLTKPLPLPNDAWAIPITYI